MLDRLHVHDEQHVHGEQHVHDNEPGGSDKHDACPSRPACTQ